MTAAPAWDKKLNAMNRGKAGRPLQYANCITATVAVSCFAFGTAYCECKGAAKKAMEYAPDQSAPCRRINKLYIEADDGKISVTGKGRTVCMAVDGAGIIPATR